VTPGVRISSFTPTLSNESETALYTECLRVASAAHGPGTPIQTVRESAKALFEQALADVAAVGKKATS
jgi:hypothetical protein